MFRVREGARGPAPKSSCPTSYLGQHFNHSQKNRSALLVISNTHTPSAFNPMRPTTPLTLLLLLPLSSSFSPAFLPPSSRGQTTALNLELDQNTIIGGAVALGGLVLGGGG